MDLGSLNEEIKMIIEIDLDFLDEQAMNEIEKQIDRCQNDFESDINSEALEILQGRD